MAKKAQSWPGITGAVATPPPPLPACRGHGSTARSRPGLSTLVLGLPRMLKPSQGCPNGVLDATKYLRISDESQSTRSPTLSVYTSARRRFSASTRRGLSAKSGASATRTLCSHFPKTYATGRRDSPARSSGSLALGHLPRRTKTTLCMLRLSK